MDNPIRMSFFSGVVVFVASLLILRISKPRMVLQPHPNGSVTLLWGKMIILSIVFGVLVSIVMFLVAIRNIVEPFNTIPDRIGGAKKPVRKLSKKAYMSF